MAKRQKKADTPCKLRCEEVDPGEAGTYDWVKATVDLDDDGENGGSSVLMTYHCTGLEVDGSDSFADDTLQDWSDKDVQDVVGSMLGIVQEDRHLIQVEFI